MLKFLNTRISNIHVHTPSCHVLAVKSFIMQKSTHTISIHQRITSNSWNGVVHCVAVDMFSHHLH